MGKTINTTKQNGGLYYFKDGQKISINMDQISYFADFFVLNNKDDIMLWHLRLGHPSFKYLKDLIPKLFVKEYILIFQCEVCEFSNNTVFFQNKHKLSKTFSVTSSDISGHNRINS